MRSLFSLFAQKSHSKPQGLLAKEALSHFDTEEALQPEWIVSPAPLKNAFIKNYQAFDYLSELHSFVESLEVGAARIAILSTSNTQASAAVSLFLGRALVQSGNRVLALDFKNPVLKAGEVPKLGLTDLVAGDLSVIEALQIDKKSDLNLIHAGQRRMTLEALFAHKSLERALEPLMLSYERVLMDFGSQYNRFLFEKIAAKATLILIVGEGCERHQNLMELFKAYNHVTVAAVMQDAKI
jgi:Mrp family chromosome partitioning ATPase